MAIVAAAAAALLIIPQPDNDPAAEAYALQALAEPSSDGEPQGLTEPTYEVADQPLETNELENWSALDSDAAAAFELSMFRRRTETTNAPATTEAPTTAAPATVPPTTKAPVTTTTAPTTASEPETTEATKVETSNEEQSAAPAADAATAEKASETTETSATTPTTVAETTTTAPPTTAAPTTAAPTTAANNGYVNAGHGVYVPPILLEIRRCESGGNYNAANPYSSARGAYQFLTGSWAAYGHAARYGVSQAHLATNAQQDEAALITWQRDGTRPWAASRNCWG